jgi:hypothetical protein
VRSYLEAVKSYLGDIGFKYTKHDTKPLLYLGFSGENGNWNCVADVKEEKAVFIFYSILSSNVPEATRAAAAEYLTRANYNLILGNFELDFSDGEVRFKTSVNMGGEPLTKAVIEPMVLTNLAMVDRYLPGLMAVAYGGKSPEEAIREAEA